jgi:hypothetical protein
MSPQDMYTEKELELLQMRQQQNAQASQQAAPANLMPTTGVGVPKNESTPNPPAPDMARLVKDTAVGQGKLREEAPPMFTDDQQKIAYGVGGLALLTYLGSKLFGDGGDTPPPSGSPSSNKRASVRDRSIMREPQMDVSTKGAQEPSFAQQPAPAAMQEPVAKPATTAPLPQATMAGQQQPQMQYGQTTMNAPVGTPSPLPAGPAAPPVQANAPIAPKPIDPIVQARIDSMAAAERRAQELHEVNLADKKQKLEAAKQKSQGQPVSQYSNTDKQLNQQSQQNKVANEIAAVNKPKTTPVANVEKTLATLPETPIVPVASAPAPTVAAVTTTAVAPSPEKVAAASKPPTTPVSENLTKEQKGMKNYLVSQYGGGPDGEAAYKKVIDILGEVPAYEKGQGGGLTPEANNTIKEWRKINIEGPKVNLTNDIKKVMKGGGGAAILMALPGFAEAAQRKDVGKMSDIFTDFFVLPFAQSREAGMSKAQEEDIIASKFKEAAKLGSPYRSVPPPKK